MTSFLLWLKCPLQSLLMSRACQCLVSFFVFFLVCAQRAILMRSAAGTAGRQTPWLQCRKVMIKMNFTCMDLAEKLTLCKFKDPTVSLKLFYFLIHRSRHGAPTQHKSYRACPTNCARYNTRVNHYNFISYWKDLLEVKIPDQHKYKEIFKQESTATLAALLVCTHANNHTDNTGYNAHYLSQVG